ncbi:hypothetical protein AF91_05205 [Lacticaseibacillus paracasei N1115]|uniref:Uncharacterized protein n=1 Tax=Lacticaseibacillus paracasei N1115 TaxID=1446494 RepID=A0A806LD22_LACPA|nr:hypothetical protein AF91_05205 [Lacticaseibacillus paracasei N1115]
MRYPKRAYTFSVDYFSTPESVDPFLRMKGANAMLLQVDKTSVTRVKVEPSLKTARFT